MSHTLPILIILTAVGSGAMSGLFFTFSNFVMPALGKLPPSAGSAAMQSINVTIINPLFMLFFMGTAVLGVAVAVFAALNWGRAGSAWILAGSVLYLVGCMFVTIRFNVPLNDQLAALDPELPENFPKWKDYIKSWQPWNHVRTVSTLASTAAFAVALAKS